MANAQLRDWEPGDGLRCYLAKRSPVPCGPPVKTAVSVESSGPRSPNKTVRRPMCSHHASARVAGTTLGAVRAEAERMAYQRLAHEHWDEFQALVSGYQETLLARIDEVES